MKKFILLLLLLLSFHLSFSQTLQLYVNIVRSDDNRKATLEMVDNMINILSDDFAQYGIDFRWNGEVQERYFNGALVHDYLAQFDRTDGINIYVFGDNEDKAAAGADYIAIGSGQRRLSNGDDVGTLETSLITHEMGHVLGLIHTQDDSNEVNDPLNFMNDYQDLTTWEEFSNNQLSTIQANICSRRHLLVSTYIPPGWCPSSTTCDTPTLNNTSFTTTNFGFENWRITRINYGGIVSGTWEWEILSGNMWGAGGITDWIMWKDAGSGINLRVRLTNDCGSTSAWKETSISPN